jgi:uncharacterized protein YabN with tetrapyrrole methylase and pyrophosphatase domain
MSYPPSFKNTSILVQGWAKDRGIYEQSTVINQLDKAQEELNETRDAVVRLQQLREIEPLFSGHEELVTRAAEQVIDGIGDTLVCLINASKMLDIDPENALWEAYLVIRDRKGKMVNGKFVKES